MEQAREEGAEKATQADLHERSAALLADSEALRRALASPVFRDIFQGFRGNG